jgi:hypothetical protein
MQVTINITPSGLCAVNITPPEADHPVTVASDNTPPAIGKFFHKLGGLYAGISRGEDGQPDGHLALIEHKADKAVTWAEAKKWAASFGDGSRLPTKVEAALLYANLKDEFRTDDGYWTDTPYSDTSAWCQLFDDGYQSLSLQTGTCLARAVRRFPL